MRQSGTHGHFGHAHRVAALAFAAPGLQCLWDMQSLNLMFHFKDFVEGRVKVDNDTKGWAS